MKKNIFKTLFIISVVSISPILVYAESDICKNAKMNDVKGILTSLSCILSDYVIPLLFTLAVVAFVWGVIQFYLNPNNEEKRKKGKEFIVGGLIALFVMVSIWGIIKIFTTTFGFDENNAMKSSQLPHIQVGQ